MKKIIIVVQIFIGILILVKVASVFGLMNKENLVTEVTTIASQALAQSKAPETPTAKPQSEAQAGKPAARRARRRSRKSSTGGEGCHGRHFDAAKRFGFGSGG